MRELFPLTLYNIWPLNVTPVNRLICFDCCRRKSQEDASKGLFAIVSENRLHDESFSANFIGGDFVQPISFNVIIVTQVVLLLHEQKNREPPLRG